jgi:ribosome-associated protein
MSRTDTRQSLERAARAALDKKADDLALLGLAGSTAFTSYFLICTGQSSRQVQAISDGIAEQLARFGVHPHHIEGYECAEWVLLDYGDFVVHVFSPASRSFYDLERLWRRAARLPIPEERRAGVAE